MKAPAALFIVILILLSGCSDKAEDSYAPAYSSTPPLSKRQYLFGVHPQFNPKKIFEIYGPLIDYLNARLNDPDSEIVLEASRSYELYDQRLYSGRFHFSLPNPYQAILSLNHGYVIFGKMDNDEDFHGIIIVRKDSGIKKPEDLRGKTLSFPGATALAGTMLPQLWLAEHGLDLMHESEINYVGTHESAMMNVYLGRAAGGAMSIVTWRGFEKTKPEVVAALDLKWHTPSLPGNALLAREDLPAELLDKVSGLIFGLEQDAEGRAILARMGIPRFVPANRETYRPVIDFLARFNLKVRPIKE